MPTRQILEQTDALRFQAKFTSPDSAPLPMQARYFDQQQVINRHAVAQILARRDKKSN